MVKNLKNGSNIIVFYVLFPYRHPHWANLEQVNKVFIDFCCLFLNSMKHRMFVGFKNVRNLSVSLRVPSHFEVS